MGAGLIDDFTINILSVPFCPYHFVHTIVSVPFCPLPFCPRTSGSSNSTTKTWYLFVDCDKIMLKRQPSVGSAHFFNFSTLAYKRRSLVPAPYKLHGSLYCIFVYSFNRSRQ